MKHLEDDAVLHVDYEQNRLVENVLVDLVHDKYE